MIEPAAKLIGERAVRDHLSPVEQQIIIIENILLLLGVHIGGE
jgi:hypothetical protein